MKTFLAKLFDLIKTYLNIKKINKEIEIKKYQKEIKEERKEVEKQKQEASDAVYKGDTDTINKIINMIFIIAIAITLTGCINNTVYVPSDRQVKRIIYENVKGYFVPDVVMVELLQYKIDAKYYKDLYEQTK